MGSTAATLSFCWSGSRGSGRGLSRDKRFPQKPLRLLSNPEWSIRSKRYYQKSVPSALYQGGGNARRCHVLTLCKSTVLGAAFLAGLAIAAKADPASTSAAGTVANGASGSQPQGRCLAAPPALHCDAASKQRNTAGEPAKHNGIISQNIS